MREHHAFGQPVVPLEYGITTTSCAESIVTERVLLCRRQRTNESTSSITITSTSGRARVGERTHVTIAFRARITHLSRELLAL